MNDFLESLYITYNNEVIEINMKTHDFYRNKYKEYNLRGLTCSKCGYLAVDIFWMNGENIIKPITCDEAIIKRIIE